MPSNTEEHSLLGLKERWLLSDAVYQGNSTILISVIFYNIFIMLTKHNIEMDQLWGSFADGRGATEAPEGQIGDVSASCMRAYSRC
jgi:hypothetical protein